MFNNVATIITKEFILSNVSEQDIFLKYLGLAPTPNGSFVNPLRKGDHSPGCGFYINNKGVWKFKDYAGGFNWDCFNVVEYDYGITFKEALIRIAIDFNLIDGNSTSIYRTILSAPRKKHSIEIRIKRRSWTKQDYSFWSKYFITPERLEFFQIFPIQQAWFLEEGVLRPIYYNKYEDPCFCYHFDNYDYKLYFPLREKSKFIHVKSSILQGWKQLPSTADNFLYTKSFKDVLCIDVVGRDFDLFSIAPMSETVLVPTEVHSNIYNRFDNLGTLFDFDRTGIRLTKKYQTTYSTIPLFFGKQYRGNVFGKTRVKDFADYLLIHGVDNTKRLVEKFIKIEKYDGEAF